MNSPSILEAEDPRDSYVAPPDQVTTEIAAPMTAGSERCPSCATAMAPDQRYCINCGERRMGGGLRDTMQRTRTVEPVAAAPVARRAWMSPSSNLIAGIATLLIAMGVGVLIGRTGDGNSGTPVKNAAVQVVTVPAAGASAATTAAATTAGSASAASKSAKARKSAAAKKKAAAAAKAPAKKNLPPAVVKVGAPGHGKGYKNGKFTGDFFGQ